MADEESEAETIPGALDESVPVSSTQLARRSLWKRTESGGTGTGNGARGHGSRRYQRLQPHMKTATAQTIDVPAECSRSHSTGLAQQIRYIPVEDPREGLSYMMCSFCMTDRIFEQVPALLQHMRSGECPLGQKELMQSTCFGEPGRSGPVPWTADSRELSQRDMEGQSALSGPRRNEASEGFALRRKMLSEMRLLQPFRYAELATEPVGLLNRSVQELSILVQAARNRPEGSGEPEAMRSKGRALGSRRMAKGPQRSFVEALASRLRSQGTSMKCPFTFAQYRAFCDVSSQAAAEAETAQDTKTAQSCS